MNIHRDYITLTGIEDENFSGTLALRDDHPTLPDGSVMSLGIEGRRWVLLFQETPTKPFRHYLYNAAAGYIEVDGNPGTIGDVREMMRHIQYFFDHVKQDELVALPSY